MVPILVPATPPGFTCVSMVNIVFSGSEGTGFMTLPPSTISMRRYLSVWGAAGWSSARFTTSSVWSGSVL
eukprot:CAMPEP_0114137262 /NCGR_PEP_ID=MMETSP0043_2-20121206/15683_1 /TAXON_ID=464988 /ORGANISM="Hemiselmis andersenii, Strain CCMP644" /LENGTH=69 /DNA_ID=CAMNT_0001231129 /DNA_START=255 /DNA_END=464 /DNA_ORIENTATION=+